MKPSPSLESCIDDIAVLDDIWAKHSLYHTLHTQTDKPFQNASMRTLYLVVLLAKMKER